MQKSYCAICQAVSSLYFRSQTLLQCCCRCWVSFFRITGSSRHVDRNDQKCPKARRLVATNREIKELEMGRYSVPANPRLACHWPSWTPDTNRDSWIHPAPKNTGIQIKTRTKHPRERSRTCFISSSPETPEFTDFSHNHKHTNSELHSLKLNPRLTFIRRSEPQSRRGSQGSSKRPCYRLFFLLPVFTDSVWLLFPGPPCVTHLFFPVQTLGQNNTAETQETKGMTDGNMQASVSNTKLSHADSPIKRFNA